MAHETTIEQPKYFDRKRRLLAAEQQISPPEIDTLNMKKNSPHKKACLDEIVDSLNQKAQAEREDDDEQEQPQQRREEEDDDDDEGSEIEVRLIKQEQLNNEDENGDENLPVETSKDVTSPLAITPIPTTEQEEHEDDDEDVDIDDAKLTVDDDH